MSQTAYEQGDWKAVIDHHPLESHDPQAWLRYGAALLQTVQPGPEALRQQQQAALAFLQAEKEGATELGVQEAKSLVVLEALRESLNVAGLEQAAQATQKRCRSQRAREVMGAKVRDALLQGEWQAAQELIRQWIASMEEATPGHTPAGVEETVWSELLLNACASRDQRLPRLWLVESRSLPRSGHHFLKSLLEQACGEQFSYCEGYQEPGCCKASPCSVSAYWHFAREHRMPHLRLLKSHDFTLADATFPPPPGMVRLIQVRRPLNLLVSWLELQQLELNRELLKQSSIVVERVFLYHEPEVLAEAWRVIDQSGTVMSEEQVQHWLHKQQEYVVGFLKKWLPLTTPFPFGERVQSGNLLLRYEDLGRCQQLMEAFGLNALQSESLPAFSPRHPRVKQRRASRVTALIEANWELLVNADHAVMAAVPALWDLYPEGGNS